MGMLSQSFEVSIAVVYIIIGYGFAAMAAKDDGSALTVLMPLWQIVALSLMFGLGGAILLTGLAWFGNDSRARLIEQAGLYLSGAAVGTFGLLVYSTFPNSQTTWLQAAALSIGAVGRIIFIKLAEKSLQRTGAIPNGNVE